MSKCVIVTHGHKEWLRQERKTFLRDRVLVEFAARKLDRHIKNVVKRVDPDIIVSLSSNPYWLYSIRPEDQMLPDLKYNIPGARHFVSWEGELNPDAKNTIKNSTEFYLMGGYWQGCHRTTTNDIVELISKRRKGGRIIYPTRCIFDAPDGYNNPSKMFLSDEVEGQKSDPSELYEYFTEYEREFEKLGLNFERELDRKNLEVSYRIK